MAALAAFADALKEFYGPVNAVPILRILLAAVLGGMIGWEREQHGREAGLRTHLLLCVGCTLVMLVSLYLPARFAQQAGAGIVRADPGRLAGNVLSGIGFLGAGAIITLGRRIRGLTTAACIWVTAAIGLAVGCGYIVPALWTFLLAVFALHTLGRWEKRMAAKDRDTRLVLYFSKPGDRLAALSELLLAHGYDLADHSMDWQPEEVVYRLGLKFAAPQDIEAATHDLVGAFAEDGLSRVRWE